MTPSNTAVNRGQKGNHSRHPGGALLWSLLNTAVGRFGTLAIGIVLARLLGPAEFGLYAVAFVALMAVLSFNELGVSLAIVRWKDDPAAIAPTVTTISLAMSLVLTGLVILLAPAFATAMGNPKATNLVRLLSLCVLINGVVATPAALMQRLFRQGQRMVADQVNVWVGAIVSVLLAVEGFGAISLVVGRLAGASLSAILFLYYSPLPYRLGLNRAYLRPLLNFGLPLAGASVLVFLVTFVDQVLVGHLLGPMMLGFYVLASNLASWPISMFSQPLRAVAPALFSRKQHDPDMMRNDFRRVLRPLAAVSLPVCAVMSATAPEIVRFVYGDAWAPAADVLRWLAVLAALRILFELAYDFLVVLGRSTTILVIQVAWIMCLVPAIWLGVTARGVAGASMALVAVSLVVSLPMYVVAFRRTGIRARRLASSSWPPLVVALLTGGAALLLTALIETNFLALLACGGITTLSIAIMLLCWRDDLRVLRRVEA